LSELGFYLDENVDPEIAAQLNRHGLNAITVQELQLRGERDESHLQLAAQMGRVLVTHDQDFLVLNAEGSEHSGIAYMPHQHSTIGAWVRGLRDLHARISAEEAKGQVFFISTK
jgi:predicted nucleic acid-binding protein